jgi:hypothetical protein
LSARNKWFVIADRFIARAIQRLERAAHDREDDLIGSGSFVGFPTEDWSVLDVLGDHHPVDGSSIPQHPHSVANDQPGIRSSGRKIRRGPVPRRPGLRSAQHARANTGVEVDRNLECVMLDQTTQLWLQRRAITYFIGCGLDANVPSVFAEIGVEIGRDIAAKL